MNQYKKFISPRELMKKFNISSAEYSCMLDRGLPIYSCAGVHRHAIDEIYLWCEENGMNIEDNSQLCNATELAKVFGVSVYTITKWEEKGMPKKVVAKSHRNNRRVFMYDTQEVLYWLKGQKANMEVR